ncbi:moi [Drosophila busckii]|uniref:Moi n=1 Tax=Drosophila busckii TaxID=30019 RepID=A0A0M4F7K2_DROBS|nr:uncharacterized protein LOC108601907 [Drosophila busckii]ALC47870.1 moi [Drosophila busckii]
MCDGEVEETAVSSENLPKYCNYFKNLLVEELALEPDYTHLHYGKCAVIGRLSAISDYIKLENVTVPHFPSECKLPIGVVSLLLLNFSYENSADDALSPGCYCIVRGEVVLYNVQKPNQLPITSLDLHHKLNLFGDKEEARAQLLQQVLKTYKPAINVWHSRRIDQPEELIQHRLEIRALVTQ